MNTVDGWISTEKRLPELKEVVLGCFENKEMIVTYILPHGNFSPIWQYVQPLDRKRGTITHWRGLPSPPEEKGD